VRNDGYANPRTGKPANLDGIVFRWYDGPAALIAAYRDNQIDLATDLQDADIPNLQDLGTQVSEIPALLYEFLRPNWSPGPFETGGDHPNTGGCSRNPAVADRGIGCPTSDPAIRAAIAFAIDKNEINLRLLGGSAQIANTNVSPVAWFYAAQPPAGYDPERARTLLDAAGWTVGPDGIREKGGLKARLELCTTDDQVRRDTMFLVGSWLRNIGIDSVINAVPSTSIFAPYNTATNDTPCAMSRSNFDLALHAFNSSIDPLGYYYTYHSSRFGPLGANYAQVDDPEIDRALDEVRSSVDFGLVRDAMATFQARYVEQTVEVPLFYRKKVELAAPKVGNYVANGTLAGSCWNAEDWFVRG
jgi:ABC-type transport system substrate-binding protein